MKFYSSIIFASLCSLATGNFVREQTIEKSPFEELMRIVCSLNPDEDTFISWNGTIYDVQPNQAQTVNFKVSGFNVARCYEADGLVFKSSRELMLYLDPETGEPLDKWTNPSGEEVSVMHVANNPATFPIGSAVDPQDVDFLIGGDFATFTSNVPLFYPNPVRFNPVAEPYAPYENYQAQELFQWMVKTQDLKKNNGNGSIRGNGNDNIPDVTVAWTRTSPYLPWMNVPHQEGYLQFTATASKVSSFDDLFPVLKQVVNERVPIYKTAPPCVLANPSGRPKWASETSWSNFAKNVNEYIDGASFPLPDTQDTLSCLA